MPSRWESVHADLTRSIRSEKSRRTFGILRSRHPDLHPFADGPSLVCHFNTPGGSAATLDRKDQIAGVLVGAASNAGTSQLPIELLLLGVWPGLTSAFGRLLRVFEGRPSELASEIVATFAVCARRIDLGRCRRVVSTLVWNTERDVLSAWKAERATADRTETLSTEAEEIADEGSEAAVALADLRIWLAGVVPRDVDLILSVCLAGRDCHQAGDALGMNHETARKRFARAMAKVRPLLRHGAVPDRGVDAAFHGR